MFATTFNSHSYSHSLSKRLSIYCYEIPLNRNVLIGWVRLSLLDVITFEAKYGRLTTCIFLTCISHKGKVSLRKLMIVHVPFLRRFNATGMYK